MLMTEADQILDDLLSRWHHWMKGKPLNGMDGNPDPLFKQANTRSGWDSADDVLDREIEANIMAAVDFHVSGDQRGQGGLAEPYRSAIYILARNCYTGRKVWISPRLPRDPLERGRVIAEARAKLTGKLIAAGVM